jgi:hypothetical protein
LEAIKILAELENKKKAERKKSTENVSVSGDLRRQTFARKIHQKTA